MKNQKIVNKLEELKKSLSELKKLHHLKGKDNLESYRNLLKRIIDRIYPEKDAKELKKRLINRFWVLTGKESDDYWQKNYLDHVDRAIKVINTILEEGSLFGFGDFKPIKEETEVQIGSKKFGFWRKKKTK